MTMTLPSLAPTARPAPRSLAAAALAVRINPLVRATLILFILSIPFEMPPGRTIPIEVPTATGVLFLLTTLLNPRACYRRIPAALGWFVAWFWMLAISVIVNQGEHLDRIIHSLLAIVQALLMMWAMFNLMADKRVMRDVLLTALIAGAARAGFQLLHIGTTTVAVWTGGSRVSVLGQNPNYSAMVLSAALAIVAGLYMIKVKGLPRPGVFCWPIGAAIGFAIIETGSRGGLLCAAIGLSVYWFRGRTVGQKLRNIFLGVLAVVGLAYGALHTEVMRNRIEQTATEGRMAGREYIYPALVQMFLERPVIGWGLQENQFEIARRIRDTKHQSRDAHNIVLELLTTCGVPGAALFLTGLALVIRASWRSRNGPLGALPMGVLAATLVGTISGTWIESKLLWFAIALALTAGAHWSATRAPELRYSEPCAA